MSAANYAIKSQHSLVTPGVNPSREEPLTEVEKKIHRTCATLSVRADNKIKESSGFERRFSLSLCFSVRIPHDVHATTRAN